MRLPLVVLPLTLLAGCHPLACFIPADLPNDPPLVLTSKADWPKANVDVLTDDFGVPHLYGQSEADLAYALGVMHGRDRAFQIYLFIHAGEGRLTEILGEDLLEIDRQNRLLMFAVDEQIASFSPRDKEITEAYCAGLNQGAAMAGDSAEMAILGVKWETATPRDVLAVARLQQWDQGVGFAQEMARWRLVKALGADSPVVKALLQDTSSGGVPIVSAEENQAVPFTGTPTTTGFHVPVDPPTAAPSGGGAVPSHASSARDILRRSIAGDMAAMFSRGGTGASNSWSVDPAHTEKGVAVLANDPHLGHSAPGIFYMVDMHGPDFTIAGGSFPGIPAVLIGHGQDIAWGITNAYADTQDVVVIQKRAGLDNTYVLDGQDYAFGLVNQTFKLGHDDKAKVITETWKTTVFGPVLPPRYGSYGGVEPVVADGEELALMWTASQFPADNAKILSAFWDLAKSKNVDEATTAIQSFGAPAMSFNMAFTDGTIAYRLSGIIPLRGDAQRADFPRLGTSKNAGWVGRVPADQKPHITSPPKGYIVASNQRIVENGVSSQVAVGFEGARPYRAMRIDKRIRALLDGDKKAKTDDLLAIQQDVTSVDAQQLAPILAKHCPAHVDGHDDTQVKAFCDAIAKFDGVYTADAHALPFSRLEHELMHTILRAHLNEDIAIAVEDQAWAELAFVDILVKEDAGEPSPVLDDPKTPGHEGLDVFEARAAKTTLDLIVAEAGGSADDWRWGKLHTLSLRGALHSAPFIGGLFETAAREESGTNAVPRAEGPDFNNKMRVSDGAGLRLIAEMTTPPTIRMVNDSGESGHFGSKHLEDQYPLWHDGKPRVLSLSKQKAKDVHEGAMTIKPKK